MATRDDEYIPEAENEIEEHKQEAGAKKSKKTLPQHYYYCPKAYSYSWQHKQPDSTF